MTRNVDLLEQENFSLRLMIHVQRLALVGLSAVFALFLGVMLWV